MEALILIISLALTDVSLSSSLQPYINTGHHLQDHKSDFVAVQQEQLLEIE
jgi:hypothetical protein